MASTLRPAFEAVFAEGVSYVHRTLSRLGVPARDVEDGVQEVFVRVHQRFDTYDARRPLRPWLFAFAYHYASNHRRLVMHRVSLEPVPDAASEESPETHLEQAEARSLLLRSLASIPPERRAVLVAHELDGFTPREIADALGLSVNTVYSRLRIARQELDVAVRHHRAREPHS